MNYVHIVAVLAIVQYFVFGIFVGLARDKYGVQAPATSGHPAFDRAFRIHQNTLEQLVGFLPALLIAGHYWSQAFVAGVGAIYLIGRLLYRQLYLANPDKRAPGFLLTVIPTFVLLVAAILGAIMRGG